MVWYAVDSIDDALDITREFLFPFSLNRWARLALLTLFVGGGGTGLGTLQNIVQIRSTGEPPGPGLSNLPQAVIDAAVREVGPEVVLGQLVPSLPGLSEAILIVLLGVALAVGLGIGTVSAVFEFVFVDALVTDEIRILRPSRNYLSPAVRYFAFQIGIGILAIAPLITAGIIVSTTDIDLGVVGFLGGFLLVLLIAVPYLFVARFTREFVIPVMIETDNGVVASWKRLGRRLRQEWKQLGVYLLLHFLIKLGVGIVRGLIAFLGVVLIGVVALIVGIGMGLVIETLLGGVAGAIEIGLVIAAIIGGVAFFVLIALPLNIVVQTYLRVYELGVLGGFGEAAFAPSLEDWDGSGRSASGTANRAETEQQPNRDGEPGDDTNDSTGETTDPDDAFQEFVPASDRTDDEQEEPD